MDANIKQELKKANEELLDVRLQIIDNRACSKLRDKRTKIMRKIDALKIQSKW